MESACVQVESSVPIFDMVAAYILFSESRVALVAAVESFTINTVPCLSFVKLLKLYPHVQSNAQETRIKRTDTTSKRIDLESFINFGIYSHLQSSYFETV